MLCMMGSQGSGVMAKGEVGDGLTSLYAVGLGPGGMGCNVAESLKKRAMSNSARPRPTYQTRQVVKWPRNSSFCDFRVKSENMEDKNNEEVTRCMLTIVKKELLEKKVKKNVLLYWKKSALKLPLFSDPPTPYIKTMVHKSSSNFLSRSSPVKSH